jgi:hypothetical protein
MFNRDTLELHSFHEMLVKDKTVSLKFETLTLFAKQNLENNLQQTISVYQTYSFFPYQSKEKFISNKCISTFKFKRNRSPLYYVI